MSSYSLRQILRQEPAAIVAVLAHFFALAIALDWFTLTATAVGLIDSLALAVLTLFYVRPLTSSKDSLAELRRGSPGGGGAG